MGFGAGGNQWPSENISAPVTRLPYPGGADGCVSVTSTALPGGNNLI